MKLNWFKLVQFCLDLDQLPQKCIFFYIKRTPKKAKNSKIEHLV